MKNSTPVRGVFLWNDPDRIHLQVGEGRGSERASSVAQLNLFQNIFTDDRGVVLSRTEVRVFFGDTGTLVTNFETLRKTRKESVNSHQIRVITQVGGKFWDVDRSRGG